MLQWSHGKSRFADIVAELAGLGYFERAFGSSCCDSDDKPDAVGQQQLSHPLRENQLDGQHVRLWPMRPADSADPSTSWSDGLLYDLIEALHDLVARPLSRSWHDFGGEWDYYDYARRPGQAVYRWRINELLDGSEVPLRLAGSGEDTGRLVTSTGDARDDLMERALQSPEPKVRERVEHAVPGPARGARNQAGRDPHARGRARAAKEAAQAAPALRRRELAVRHREQLRASSPQRAPEVGVRPGVPRLGVLVVPRHC